MESRTLLTAYLQKRLKTIADAAAAEIDAAAATAAAAAAAADKMRMFVVDAVDIAAVVAAVAGTMRMIAEEAVALLHTEVAMAAIAVRAWDSRIVHVEHRIAHTPSRLSVHD
jgi:hypothetical protein